MRADGFKHHLYPSNSQLLISSSDPAPATCSSITCSASPPGILIRHLTCHVLKSNPQSSTPKPGPPPTLRSQVMAAHPTNCSMPKPWSYPFFLSPLLQDLKSSPAINPAGRDVKVSLGFDHPSPPPQPDGLQSTGLQRVGHDSASKHRTPPTSTAVAQNRAASLSAAVQRSARLRPVPLWRGFLLWQPEETFQTLRQVTPLFSAVAVSGPPISQ